MQNCYSIGELIDLGVKFDHEYNYKTNSVHINRTVQLFNAKSIRIGNNVRIDAYCILVGPITIGDFVHIGATTSKFGSEPLIVEPFANVSSRVSFFTENDDYTDGFMAGPMVPPDLRKVSKGKITLKKHSIIGCGTVVLPGVTLDVGASVGALSLVNKSVPYLWCVTGNPARKICLRDDKLLELEKEFLRRRSELR